MPSLTAPANQARRPLHELSHAVKFLTSVLPRDPAAFDAALQNSRGALALVDHWLNLDCIGVLSSDAIKFETDANDILWDDYPVGSLLCLPSDAGQWHGLDALKAMLLADRFMERQETELVVDLVSGLKKAALNKGRWRTVLPGRLAPTVGLIEAIEACREFAAQRLDRPEGINPGLLKWLKQLERWCNLLAEPPRKYRWVLTAPAPAQTLSTESAAESEEEGDDRSPWTAISFVEPDPEDDPCRPGVEEDEPHAPELPNGVAPEASPSNAKAEPRKEGEPETIEGGEARRARTGFRSALENQRLRWINDQLVPRDVSDLVHAIKLDIAPERDRASQDAAGLVGLAMVFGTLLEEVVEWKFCATGSETYFDGPNWLSRLVPPSPGAWTPSAQQDGYMRRPAERLLLAVPAELAAWVARIFLNNEEKSLGAALALDPVSAVERVRTWLTTLRSQTNGSQTLGRVERWLACALYQECLDHAEVHFISTSPDAPPCPAAYYRAYPAASIEETHWQTVAAVGWTVSATEAKPTPQQESGWVGSRLNPELDCVAEMWASTRGHFSSIAADSSRDLRVRHNAREIHEVFALIFQTFHRIVSDPIESLELLDLVHARILIEDKRQGDTRAHRLVPLPQLATQQCEEHIEHLWRLASNLQGPAPETATRILTMLADPSSRAAPFRFLLGSDLQIVRITPGLLMEALRGLWLLPLNTARHMGATWLLSQGATDRQVCSLLGHHDLGTLELSPLSPADFETLFGDLRPKIETFMASFGLQSIPSFLPPIASRPTVPRDVERPAPMQFGYLLRESSRGRQLGFIRALAEDWMSEQLNGRKHEALTQNDVDALFEKVRRSTPNGRTHWARQRFEAMREVLVAVIRKHPELKVELPAVAITVKDVAHICPMDTLSAGRWLVHLRDSLGSYWAREFKEWRRAQLRQEPKPYVAKATDVAISLVLESLVIDPVVWTAWFKAPAIPDAFVDQSSRTWLRMPLPSGNSRLYPLHRDLAELISSVPAAEWTQLKPEALVKWVRSATAKFQPAQPLRDFWQLLNRIQSGLAPDVPGVILGFADGSHSGVSPEDLCLERSDGLGPTVASVEDWKARRQTRNAEALRAPRDAGEPATNGQLGDVVAFRKTMSAALALAESHRGKKSKGHRAVPASDSSTEKSSAKASRKTDSNKGPITRFREHLESNWDDLAGSQALPPMCALTARWMHALASDGHRGGGDYSPKTLKNYWYSWALRIIEEFGPLIPRTLSPAELEELYLEIVDSAEVQNRQHLYAPMRNLHQYLVVSHGVCEIEWSALRRATDQGTTWVDGNVVYLSEYLRALNLLREDPFVSERVRVMQAVALVLVFRCGLRIAEALGLRDTDVYRHAGRWHVRIARNQYRRLKTDNARRTVPILELLTAVEEQLLEAWSGHVGMFSSGQDIKPLFSTGQVGEARRELFPKRMIALRIAQALRLATGDPSTRIHHCRHAYATRVLSAVLSVTSTVTVEEGDAGKSGRTTSQTGRATVTVGTNGSMNSEAARLYWLVSPLAFLTSEDSPTRRALWALASLLGHGSPMTTLESYFHAGHELLLEWCLLHRWQLPDGVDALEWHVFASGAKLKTMQRARQRAGGELEYEVALREWTRVRRSAVGARVERKGQLEPLAPRKAQDSLVIVDRIIDHARCFGRVDGLSDQLFVDEYWIQTVLQVADEFARRRLGPDLPDGFLWIRGPDSTYRDHEIEQIDEVLQCVERHQGVQLAPFADVVNRSLVPSEDMLAIERVEDLDAVAEVISLFVFDTKHIEVLLPADSSLRQPLPARVPRPPKAQAVETGNEQTTSKAGTKLRYKHVSAKLPPMAVQIEEKARKLGFTAMAHDRVAGARESRHSSQEISDRIGLSIARKAGERTRSAKVFTRIASSIAVAEMAANYPAVASP